MAIKTRAELKAYFYDGAFITAAVWQDVIDSVMLIAEQRIPIQSARGKNNHTLTFSPREMNVLLQSLSKSTSAESKRLHKKITAAANLKSGKKAARKK